MPWGCRYAGSNLQVDGQWGQSSLMCSHLRKEQEPAFTNKKSRLKVKPSLSGGTSFNMTAMAACVIMNSARCQFLDNFFQIQIFNDGGFIVCSNCLRLMLLYKYIYIEYYFSANRSIFLLINCSLSKASGIAAAFFNHFLKKIRNLLSSKKVCKKILFFAYPF